MLTGATIEVPCLAVLKGTCGDWHFYDYGAIQVVATAIAVACSADQPTQKSFSGSPDNPDQSAELFEGFSVEQWASYGKRKSHIASAVCKENGRLKAELDALRWRGDSMSDYEAAPTIDRNVPSRLQTHADDVYITDPWREAAQRTGQNILSVDRDVGSTISTCDVSSTMAWSKWIGIRDVGESAATYTLNETDGAEEMNEGLSETAGFLQLCDWRSLPRSSWRKIHSGFAGLNGIRRTEFDADEDEKMREVLNHIPRAELRPADDRPTDDKLSGYFTELQRNIASHVFAVELHREFMTRSEERQEVAKDHEDKFDNECAPVYSSDSCSEYDSDFGGFACMNCGTTYERLLPNCLKCGQWSTVR
jgi:hypothetical protein